MTTFLAPWHTTTWICFEYLRSPCRATASLHKGQLAGSLKLQVSFEEYSLFYRALLRKETCDLGLCTWGNFDECRPSSNNLQGSLEKKGEWKRVHLSFAKCLSSHSIWVILILQSACGGTTSQMLWLDKEEESILLHNSANIRVLCNKHRALLIKCRAL